VDGEGSDLAYYLPGACFVFRCIERRVFRMMYC
jgi:hypothetical protein